MGKVLGREKTAEEKKDVKVMVRIDASTSIELTITEGIATCQNLISQVLAYMLIILLRPIKC